MFPHDPGPDPRQIAEKYDAEQEHDRDRFALHQESEPVSADQFELGLPPIGHLIHLTLVPGRRLTGLLTIAKISRAIFVNIEANYQGKLSKKLRDFLLKVKYLGLKLKSMVNK